jgi:hypothetical protein
MPVEGHHITSTTDLITLVEAAKKAGPWTEEVQFTPRELDLLLHILKSTSWTALDWRGRLYR